MHQECLHTLRIQVRGSSSAIVMDQLRSENYGRVQYEPGGIGLQHP